MSGVTALRTGRCGNRLSKLMVKLCNSLCVGCVTSLSVTDVNYLTGSGAGSIGRAVNNIVVVESGDNGGVAVSTDATGVSSRACLSTGRGNDILNVVVTKCLILIKSNLVGVAATDTELKCVAVLGTCGIYVSKAGAVAVKLTSLLGSKSCYGVTGEVVGLEGNVAVVVGSLDSLYLAAIVDEPDRDTVNVLTLGKLVGESYGDVVLFAVSSGKVGDKSVLTLDGEVIYGIVTYLSELIRGKSEVFLIFALDLIGGYGYLLIADNVLNARVKVKVGVLTYLKLVVKVGAGYLISGGDHLNRLGIVTSCTGVGNNAVCGNAIVPCVAKRAVSLDSLGLGLAASLTGESLDTFAYTGSGSGYSRSPLNVVGNGLTLYFSGTVVTFIILNVFTGLAFYRLLSRSYALDIMFGGSANRLIVLGTAGTLVIVYTGCGTSCGLVINKYMVVTGCGSDLIAAYGTYLSSLTGSSRAGGMSGCGNGLSLRLTAVTGSGLNARGGTGCGSGYSKLAPTVTGGINALGLGAATALTGKCLNACCGTAGLGSNLTFIPIVAKCHAVLMVTGRAHCGIQTGNRTSDSAFRIVCTVTALGSVTYATGSGMHTVCGLVFTPSVSKSGLTLKGAVKILVSADGAGIVICRCCCTVSAVLYVGCVCILSRVIVLFGSAVALTAEITYRKSSTGSSAAAVLKRFALGCSTVFTVLCFGTGCIYPAVTERIGVLLHTSAAHSSLDTGCSTALVSAGIAVRLVADLTYSRSFTGRRSTLVAESLALGSTTVFTVLCLGTGCIYPAMADKVAIGLITILTYSLVGTGSSAALVAESFTLCGAAHAAMLCLGTGSLDPSVTGLITVAVVTTVANRRGLASSVSAYVAELLTFNLTAHGTVLRFGTGCL